MSLRTELGKIVEIEDVSVAASKLSGSREMPLVRPGTVEEVSATVKLCHARGWSLIPTGTGSTIRESRFGTPDCDVILSTSRLNTVLEHTPADLVVRVQSGCTFEDCQTSLAPHGQRIPIGRPIGTRATGRTIGGLLATAGIGASRIRYGTPRDWVIGTTVVRSDGELVHSGGRVVKNVSGYDLSKLYIGSMGALGILVEANFKLDPTPAESARIVVSVPDSEIARAVRIVDRLRLDPWAVSSAVFDRDGELGTMEIHLEGVPEVVSGRQAQLVQLVKGHGLFECRWSNSSEPTDLGHGPGHDRDLEPGLSVRIEYPASAYLPIRAALSAIAPSFWSSARETTLLGAGVTWLTWVDSFDRLVWDAVRAALVDLGAWWQVESADSLADSPIEELTSELDPESKRLMAALKDTLDPDGLLVAGLYYGPRFFERNEASTEPSTTA